MGFMASTSPRRGYALGFLIAIACFVVISSAPSVWAAPRPIEPAAAMTVTVVLNQAAFLSGDVVSANALVYRTPGPANFTYNWTVRDTFNRVVTTAFNGPATFSYTIPLNYTGLLTVAVGVDDGQGLTTNGQRTVI